MPKLVGWDCSSGSTTGMGVKIGCPVSPDLIVG